MKHNNFKFTIKFVTDNTEKGFVNEYIEQCCDGMYQSSVESGEIITSNLRPNIYISYLTLTIKDYGVPQVGVDLIAAWIKQLYKHCDGFVIDVVIVHPKSDPPARGALIQWDYLNDCPIVRVITK